jgi:hypothetical protein
MMGRATAEQLLVLRCLDEVLPAVVQQSVVLHVPCMMHSQQQQLGRQAASHTAVKVMLQVPLAAVAAQLAAVCCFPIRLLAE